MKRLVYLLFMLPLAAMAQSDTYHESAMKKFQQFYNAGQGDSINAMLGKSWDYSKTIKPLWTNEDVARMQEEYGTLQSFKFIGIDETDPQKVWVFQTVFSKAGAKTTSCTLDTENAFSTFRFITTSDGISKLVRKAKQHNR
jgi:hypothetical protein